MNRFGDSAEHRNAVIAAGGRWVWVIYSSGAGSPQERDILALAGETPAEAAAALLTQDGFENERIYASGEEDEDSLPGRHAALLACQQRP